jgi:hypothetical protein
MSSGEFFFLAVRVERFFKSVAQALRVGRALRAQAAAPELFREVSP